MANSIELPDFTSPRVGRSASIFHGIKRRGEFCAVVNNNLRFRVRSGEFVRAGSSMQGIIRSGASEKECSEYNKERVELLVRAIRSSRGNEVPSEEDEEKEQVKLCVRCGMTYRDEDNSPVACKYHGHMTGMYACCTHLSLTPHSGFHILYVLYILFSICFGAY